MNRASPYGLRLASFAAAMCFLAACSGGTQTPGGSDAGTTIVPQSADVMSLTASVPRTWTIQAGASTLDQAFQDFDFYAHTITIAAGDSVMWRLASKEPHTITLPAGQPLPAPPDPRAFAPAGGSSYDGTVFTSSGLLGVGGTYTLKFPKAGTYKFYCLLHQPEMQGTIIVQPPGGVIPHDQSFYTHEGSIDQWNDLTAAVASVKTFPFVPRGPHLAAGIAPPGPPADSSVLRFLATNTTVNLAQIGNETIKVGTTLTWTNLSNNAPHTVTFPIAGQKPPASLGLFAPPQGGNVYDGTHLVHSGVLFPGQSFSIKFTKPGGYYYYCIFHDDEGMIAAINVQP